MDQVTSSSGADRGGASLLPRSSRIAYGALFSGIVAIAVALVALLTGRALDLLLSVYLVASVAGVALGIAGIVVTRGKRLNGRLFAVTGLIMAAFSALFLYPFAVAVALTHWEFGR